MEPAAPLPVTASATAAEPGLIRGLSLLDAVLLLVGGVVGSGIFLTSGSIAQEVRYSSLFLLVWLIGAVVSLFATFAFAELASMYPDAGGQYIYLREAYGEFPAFLYGWMIFSVAQTGTIAALAVGFAEYLGAFTPLDPHRALLMVGSWAFTRGHLVALLAITVMTWTNIAGVRRGADAQNLATWLKFAAIAVFVGLGFVFGHGSWSHWHTAAAASPAAGSMASAVGVALVAVFWAYDGWVYITWVAGEIKDAQRTLPRALMLGLGSVAAVYIGMNLAYLYALPMNRIAGETVIAQAAGETLFSPRIGRWLSCAVAISCFGAMSSAILCSARVYFAMARDGIFFRTMGRIHPRYRTPAYALFFQAIWSAVLALSGRYDELYTYVIFMMVLSYLATVVGLFVLRRKRPDVPRAYRCTGYPWIPVIYLVVAGAWALNTLVERPKESFAGLLIVLIGVPGYIYWKRGSRESAGS
jgi:basic amino acid/polyamine antiporter, APA family